MKKTKGIVVLFLSLVLVLTTIVGFGFETMPVFADDETPEFEIEDNVLVKYNGTAAEVTVPDGVTAIGGNAFRATKKIFLKLRFPKAARVSAIIRLHIAASLSISISTRLRLSEDMRFPVAASRALRFPERLKT